MVRTAESQSGVRVLKYDDCIDRRQAVKNYRMQNMRCGQRTGVAQQPSFTTIPSAQSSCDFFSQNLSHSITRELNPRLFINVIFSILLYNIGTITTYESGCDLYHNSKDGYRETHWTMDEAAFAKYSNI